MRELSGLSQSAYVLSPGKPEPSLKTLKLFSPHGIGKIKGDDQVRFKLSCEALIDFESLE